MTGARQHVGNWPGVTVEKAEGLLLGKWQRAFAAPVHVVDLPGVYSLAPFSEDEAITGRFLLETPPDVILNVVDAAHLERNLYLTLQLLELRLPVVVALTMLDVLSQQGGQVDAAKLAGRLGVPVVPVCARNGQGLAALMQQLCAARGSALLYTGGEAGSAEAGQPPMPLPGAVAARRYRMLAKLLHGCYTSGHICTKAVPADRLLVQSRLAVPVFLLIMGAVFWLAFGLPGATLAGLLEGLLETAAAGAAQWLHVLGAPLWLRGLLLEGLLPGLSSVAGFLPPLLILMLLLDLLEDSGYLTRAAFLLDRPLRRMGLSGRSLLPLAMGFGCTVPAVLCARGIKSPQERRLAILLIPLMSCSAKIPAYGALAQAFFPDRAAMIVMVLYLSGIVAAVGLGWLLNRRSASAPAFLLELPPLRRPSLGNALRQTLSRGRAFLWRILSLVALATVCVWLLSHLTPRFAPAVSLEESMLGWLAGLLSPLLAPCGFGNAAAAASLLTGLFAKESILSTLTVLADGAVHSLFASPLAAFSFLLFTLLYTPCVAAMAAIRQELPAPRGVSGFWYALFAWAVSAMVYQLGSLLG